MNLRQTSPVAMLDDLRALVECESPTEDLAACRKVTALANDLSKKILSGEIDKSKKVMVDIFDGLVVFRNEA